LLQALEPTDEQELIATDYEQELIPTLEDAGIAPLKQFYYSYAA
jgi:hypothetical protein